MADVEINGNNPLDEVVMIPKSQMENTNNLLRIAMNALTYLVHTSETGKIAISDEEMETMVGKNMNIKSSEGGGVEIGAVEFVPKAPKPKILLS